MRASLLALATITCGVELAGLTDAPTVLIPQCRTGCETARRGPRGSACDADRCCRVYLSPTASACLPWNTAVARLQPRPRNRVPGETLPRCRSRPQWQWRPTVQSRESGADAGSVHLRY